MHLREHYMLSQTIVKHQKAFNTWITLGGLSLARCLLWLGDLSRIFLVCQAARLKYLIGFFVIAQIYLSCSPVNGNMTLGSLVSDLCGLPIVFGFFIVRKLCTNRQEGGWVPLAEMDLITGRKDNLVQAHAEDKKERARW